MGTQKPGEWANSLIARFEEQLPYKTGAQNLHSRINEEQCKACLVQISRHRFSLVIAGLTKILQRVSELYQPTLTGGFNRPQTDLEKGYHDSLVIVLDTLEICLSSQPKDTTKYDEAMNVKILLREVCQFIGKIVQFDQCVDFCYFMGTALLQTHHVMCILGLVLIIDLVYTLAYRRTDSSIKRDQF
ncbi:hypothetical protein JYU34_021868 [Plutella xylostella]|uniref:Uncharacterized protein n=1 Tax=Plutella xylostella TaxID=51655 RepID=A0ABQ7PRS7_PLUXY|nr:hypothetical protein JYU34_021868 [Plutella xylostella]